MNSNREWLYWGKQDPLWAVNVQAGKEKGAAGAWTDAEFLASGQRYFAAVGEQWRQYGVGSARCLEIGCGSGRMTAQLLGLFDRVTAVDVSPEQIANAKRLLGESAARVEFALAGAGREPLAAHSIDGMFSCEVFQHFSDFSMIEEYLREGFQAMRPGGTVCFQLPVLGLHQRPGYLLRRWLTPALRLLGRRRIMEYRMYAAPRVFAALASAGFTGCELRVFPLDGHEAGQSYFFARKP